MREKQNCGGCVFSVKAIAGEEEVTQCRRFPPQIDGGLWCFPMVRDSWSCGEFRSADQQEAPLERKQRNP